MPLIEYMLERVDEGKKRPAFAKEGGLYYNPSDFTYVAWVEPASTREYYLPDTIKVFNANTFADRMVEIHNVTPILDEEATANVDITTIEGYNPNEPDGGVDPSIYFTSNTEVYEWAISKHNSILEQYGETTDE